MNKKLVLYVYFFIAILAAFVGGIEIGSAKSMDVVYAEPTPVVFIEVDKKTETPEDVVFEEPSEDIFGETLVEEKIITKQPIDENFDILTPSGYTAEDLRLALTGTSHELFYEEAESFVLAEKRYGVNSLYLMSKLALESGWGRHQAARNNIAGWTDGRGGYREFDSVEDCVLHVAMNLSTSYKEKVGTRLGDVCKRYCPTPGYTEKVLIVMRDRNRKIEAEKGQI